MIDWKRACLWGALVMAAVPQVASAAVAPDEARSSAPLATVTTDDSVEIRVQGVTAGADEVEWKWGKLVVPIAEKPEAGFAESYEDETVKRVALVGGEKPRLIVFFRHTAKTAKTLTEASSITQTGDGFRVTIPRRHALDDLAKPEPVAQVEAESELEPKPADEVAEVEADPEGDAPEEQPAAAAKVEEAPASEGAPLNLPEPGTASIGPSSSDRGMYGTLGFTLVLLAVGGAFVYWKRRKGEVPGTPRGFTVLGNQVLGPKSRIVLMGLGDRRMLLAVSEAGTTVVDKWNEGQGHVPSTSVRSSGGFDEQSLAAIEFGGPIEPPRTKTQVAASLQAYQPPAPGPELDDENAESTAVRGLLALRRQMEAVEQDADEDDAWSQALEARMRAVRSA